MCCVGSGVKRGKTVFFTTPQDGEAFWILFVHERVYVHSGPFALCIYSLYFGSSFGETERGLTAKNLLSLEDNWAMRVVSTLQCLECFTASPPPHLPIHEGCCCHVTSRWDFVHRPFIHKSKPLVLVSVKYFVDGVGWTSHLIIMYLFSSTTQSWQGKPRIGCLLLLTHTALCQELSWFVNIG